MASTHNHEATRSLSQERSEFTVPLVESPDPHLSATNGRSSARRSRRRPENEARSKFQHSSRSEIERLGWPGAVTSKATDELGLKDLARLSAAALTVERLAGAFASEPFGAVASANRATLRQACGGPGISRISAQFNQAPPKQQTNRFCRAAMTCRSPVDQQHTVGSGSYVAY